METPSDKYVAIIIKRRKVPYRSGNLIVHDRYRGDELLDSAFTFDSLTHVLDMPKSTLEGRYARGRLCNWKVDIPNGFGRPSRGFPLALLEDVINVLMTRGAKVTTGAEHDVVAVVPTMEARADLEFVAYQGNRYFTVSGLADHFGVSETTIRKKLTKANLTRRLQDLGPSAHGGRPRRGFPEATLGDIYLAISAGAVFGSQIDEVIARADVSRKAALQVMKAAIVPHELPPKNSLRAYDPQTRAPVVPLRPLNTVNPAAPSADELAEQVQRELDAIFAPKGSGEPAGQAGAPDEETPEQIHERMVAMQREALTGQVDEPTDAELRETAEMLGLSKADADRFVGDVKAGRAARDDKGEK